MVSMTAQAQRGGTPATPPFTPPIYLNILALCPTCIGKSISISANSVYASVPFPMSYNMCNNVVLLILLPPLLILGAILVRVQVF